MRIERGPTDIDTHLAELLERCPAVSNQAALEVLLVDMGRKKVAELSFVRPLREVAGADEMEEAIQGIIRICATFSLECERRDNEDEAYAYTELVVGANPEVIGSFIQANTDRERGEMLGIPESAIIAFESGTAMRYDPFTSDEIPPEMQGFLNFMPSQEHWKEEIETVRTTMEAVQQVAPRLYARLTGS